MPNELLVTPLVSEQIFPPARYFRQCHASTIALCPDGSIVAAWFAGTHENNPDVAIWGARRAADSDESAGRWSPPQVIADHPDVACWNPVLFATPTRLWLFFKVGPTVPQWYTMVQYSDDWGHTWSPARELVPGDVGGRGPVRNKPLPTTDVGWLAPASLETADRWDAFVDTSTDGGRTWQAGPLVPFDRRHSRGKGLIQPTLWQSQSGRVHMLLRSTEGFIYRSDSVDGGRNWSTAYATELPNNNSGIDVDRLDSGLLALAMNPVSGNWAERCPLVLRFSADNGVTWPWVHTLAAAEPHMPVAAAPAAPAATAVPIATVPATARVYPEFSYPAVVCRGDRVFVTYTWQRVGIAFQSFKVSNPGSGR